MKLPKTAFPFQFACEEHHLKIEKKINSTQISNSYDSFKSDLEKKYV